MRKAATVDDMHLSTEHYRPVIVGAAAGTLGSDKHLRMIAIAIGSMRDECASCLDDTIDGLALEAEAVATVHRIGSLVIGVPAASAATPEGGDIIDRIEAFPFPIRSQMVRYGLERLRTFLDDHPKPHGWA